MAKRSCSGVPLRLGTIAALIVLAAVVWPVSPGAAQTATATSRTNVQAPRKTLHIVRKIGLRPLAIVGPPHLDYFGGKVISNVEVVMVLYGTGTYLGNVVGTATPTMQSFYQQVANSANMDWLCEYNTNILDIYGRPGTNQFIGRGTWGGMFQITPDPSRNGATITDTNIQSELVAQIDGGHLPATNPNTLYIIHFPAGKAIDDGVGDTTCITICGYHSEFSHNGMPVRYGVLPDMSGGCTTGCGPTPVGSLTSTTWHELIEAVTDPDFDVNNTLAWYDTTLASPGVQWGEIGDICNQDSVTIIGSGGVAFIVQRLWSNRQNICAISGPQCSPVAVEDEKPGEFSFAMAGANPVVGSTQFAFALPGRESVELAIHDVSGRRVVRLVDGEFNAGYYFVTWRSSDGGGLPAAGVYFARLTAGGRAFTRTFVILK